MLKTAILHLGYKGGTFLYSQLHANLLDPSVIFCSSHASNSVFKARKIVFLTHKNPAQFILYSILALPAYLSVFIVVVLFFRVKALYVLDCHYWAPYFILAAKIIGVNTVFAVHDGLAASKNSYALSYYTQLASCFLSTCHLYLSPHVRDDLVAKFPAQGRKSFSICPHPAFEQPCSIHPRDDTYSINSLRFLFFGTIHHSKGYETVYYAFSELLLRKSCDFSLHVCGVPVGSVAKIHDPRVSYTLSYVPDPDIASIFRAASVILLPYTQASQSGVAVLAAQYGLFPICSNLPSLKSQIDSIYTDYLSFEPGSPESLLASIEILDQRISAYGSINFCVRLPTVCHSATQLRSLALDCGRK